MRIASLPNDTVPNAQELDSVALERKAAEVADILRALANERRLMILCKLVEWGEGSVNGLAEAVGLSQSALSQHLARMREEGLVTATRTGRRNRYRINRARREPWAQAPVGKLLDALET